MYHKLNYLSTISNVLHLSNRSSKYIFHNCRCGKEKQKPRETFLRDHGTNKECPDYDKFTKAFNKNALAKTEIQDFFATHFTSKIRIKKYSFSHLK